MDASSERSSACGVGLELALQIGVLLADDVEAVVRAIDVAALAADTRRGANGGGGSIHVRDRQRFAAHECAEIDAPIEIAVWNFCWLS